MDDELTPEEVEAVLRRLGGLSAPLPGTGTPGWLGGNPASVLEWFGLPERPTIRDLLRNPVFAEAVRLVGTSEGDLEALVRELRGEGGG